MLFFVVHIIQVIKAGLEQRPGHDHRRRTRADGEPSYEEAERAGHADDESEIVTSQLRRMTRRGFAWGGAAALAGFAAWKWVGSRGEEGLLRWPLRRVLEFDEKVAELGVQPRSAVQGLPRLGRQDAPGQRPVSGSTRSSTSTPGGSESKAPAGVEVR